MSFVALIAKLKVTMAVAGAVTVGAVVGTPAVLSMTASSADSPDTVVTTPTGSPGSDETAGAGSESGVSESGTPESNTPESQSPEAGTPQSETPDSETSQSETPETETPDTEPPTTSSSTSTTLPPCPADIRNHGAYVSSVPVAQRAAAAESDCGMHAMSSGTGSVDSEKSKVKVAKPHKAPRAHTAPHADKAPKAAKSTKKRGPSSSHSSSAAKKSAPKKSSQTRGPARGQGSTSGKKGNR